MSSRRNSNFRSGAALLVVLFVIMVITVLSLGFLSRSDVELACGRNMVLKTQMDYLAESGLEHAKGLILNPQNVVSEYYTGATGMQLVAGSDDYYDISVLFDDSDPTDQCNYIIDCNSYRVKNGQEIGRSNLTAQLRLDPCVALWIENNLTLSDSVTIFGDIFCDGTLNNNGTIDGDAFVGSLSGAITGQQYNISELSLGWPDVTVNGFKDKPGVSYQSGDFTLSENVDGMLLVDGDLTIMSESSINIIAAKSQPALYVTGDLIIDRNTNLNIEGLAVIDNRILINGGANLDIAGALFAKNSIYEYALDSSGNNALGTLVNGPQWITGFYNGAVKFDGIDDKIENYSIPDSLNGLSAITLSLWVKSEVTNQDRDILFTRDPAGSDEELGIRYDRDGVSGGGVSGIKASIRTSSGYTQIESSSGIQTTDWQHLALTWQDDPNDSRLKLYINGVLDTLRYDKEPVSGVITGIEKLMLGFGTKNTYWDGLIDEVRIYSRALDQSEIEVVKNGGTIYLSELILYWDFDESGSSINVTASPVKAAVNLFSESSDIEKWGQAVGAFYRSIERK